MKRRSMLFRAARIESLEHRRLLAAISWDSGGDGVNWSDANNWSPNVVPSGSDDVTIGSGFTVRIVDQQFTNSISNAGTLEISNSSDGGLAYLQYSAASTNSGTINLTSTGANATATVYGNVALTNTSSGTIRARTGAGGLRTLNAALVNAGTVTVENNQTLTINYNVTDTGTMQTGATNSALVMQSGTYTKSAGTDSGNVIAESELLNLSGTASGTLHARGSNGTLLAHSAANLTLSIEATNVNYGYVSVLNNLTINGPVVVTDINDINGYAASLQVGSLSTLTIGSGGSVTSTPGAGAPHTIASTSGNDALINHGTLSAAGAGLSVLITTTSDGAIAASGNSDVTFSSYALTLTGGAITSAAGSNVGLINTTLNVSATTLTGALFVRGSSNQLLDQRSAALTLNVQASNTLAYGVITTHDGATLNGPIVLTTIIDDSSGYYSGVSVAGALTINASGSITSTVGVGGPARVLNLYSAGASVINHGTISANASTLNVTVDTTSNGTLSATAGGALNFQSYALTLTGGSTTAGVGLTSSESLNVPATTVTGSLFVHGSNVLVNQLSSGLALNVECSNAYGYSGLTTTAAAALAGPLVLTSAVDNSAGYYSYLSVAAGTALTISATGSITATAGVDANPYRTINFVGAGATLINNGILRANAARLSIAIDTTSSATLSAVSGGTLDITGHRLTMTGGAASGAVGVTGGLLDVSGTGATGSLYVHSTNTLVNQLASGLTLNIECSNTLGYGVLITAAGAVTLAGPVNLSSVVDNSSGYSSYFTVGALSTLTISSSGSVTAQTGVGNGLRYLNATDATSALVNHGTLRSTGPVLQASISTDSNGTITASGGGLITFGGYLLKLSGGTVASAALSGGASLNVTSAAVTGTLAVNGTNTLINQPATGLTLDIQCSNAIGYGTLTTATPSVSIAGAVNLTAIGDNSSGYASYLNLGAGTTLTLAATSTVTLTPGTGSGARIITGASDATLINHGTITIAAGTPNPELSAKINNDGLIQATVATSDTMQINGGSGTLTNLALGTFRKLGGGTLGVYTSLLNSGLVDVASGMLRFDGSTNLETGTYLTGGRYTVANNAALRFSTFSYPLINTADVELSGSGTVNFDQLEINRGRIGLVNGANLTLAPQNGSNTFTHEGIIDLSPTSTLAITGNMVLAGASQPIIRTELASSAQFGKVLISGALNLNSPNSTSRLDPDLVSGYNPAVGSHHNVIVASGGITNAFDAFFGGATPSNNTLILERPNANTVSIGVQSGAPPAAPQILSQTYEYITRQAVVFQFNQDVSAFLSRKDYTLVNLTTSTTIPQSVGALSYNQTSNTATLLLTNQLPDGNYRLTVSASDIANAAGVPASGSPIVLDFFVLAGDANHDRHVDVADLGILATNWQKTGKTLLDGDFNYDGSVDVADLGLLATSWQKFLPAQAAPLFSGSRITSRPIAVRPIGDDLFDPPTLAPGGIELP